MDNPSNLIEERKKIWDAKSLLIDDTKKIIADAKARGDQHGTADENRKMDANQRALDALDKELDAIERKQDENALKIFREAGGVEESKERRYLDAAKTVSIISSKEKLARASQSDEPEISLGELILARIRGPKTDAEKRALSTSLDASGGISTTVSRDFWDSARAASTVVKAGASLLDFEDGSGGIVKIPQITGDPVATWKTQNAEASLSDPSFTAKSFDFKTLFAATQVSNELAQDGGSLFANMIQTSLARSFASEIDRAALLGSGSGQEPEGIALKAINSFTMGTNGGDLTNFNPLIGACKLLMDDNTPLDQIGAFIMAPRTWQELATLKSATELQQLLIPEQIRNIPWLVSSKIPVNQTVGSSSDTSSIYVGKWSDLVIGVRLDIRIKFHEQPLAQSFATLVTAATRVDFEAINLGSFCKITGITPGPDLT